MLLFTNPEELAKAKGAVDRVVRRAIALDGTCQSLSSPFDCITRAD